MIVMSHTKQVPMHAESRLVVVDAKPMCLQAASSASLADGAESSSERQSYLVGNDAKHTRSTWNCYGHYAR